MEKMELTYGAAAAQAGVLLVNSCGFDSIPADIGTLFAVDTMRNAGCLPTSIDSFVALTGGPDGLAVHYATYESAVHGFGSADELRAIRKKYNALHPETAAIPSFGAKPKRHDGLYWDARTGSYAFPFMGADASIVRRSQRTGVAQGKLTARPSSADVSDPSNGLPLVPVQYNAYMTIPSRKVAFLFMLYGSVFQLLARFSLGRKLLLKFPGLFTNGLFSHQGPSRAQIAGAKFTMTFFVQGEAYHTCCCECWVR